MSINFVINSQLYKDSIIGAYTLFWDSIDARQPLGCQGTEKGAEDEGEGSVLTYVTEPEFR